MVARADQMQGDGGLEQLQGDGMPDARGKPRGFGVMTAAQRLKHKEKCSGAKRLTIADKMEIVRLHCAPSKSDRVTVKKLALTYGVSERAISKICSDKHRGKMEEVRELGRDLGGSKMMRDETHPELTKRLLAWISNVRKRSGNDKDGELCITKHKLQCKAEDIAKEIGIPDFKATNGWHWRWCGRHGLSNSSKREKAVSMEPPEAVDSQLQEIRTQLSQVLQKVDVICTWLSSQPNNPLTNMPVSQPSFRHGGVNLGQVSASPAVSVGRGLQQEHSSGMTDPMAAVMAERQGMELQYTRGRDGHSTGVDGSGERYPMSQIDQDFVSWKSSQHPSMP
eukprot:750448-Hanusia_phi.AAC.9